MPLSSNSPLLDAPSLSPSSISASRFSIASSNSSLSLGDPGSRSSQKLAHDRTAFSGAREHDIEEELLEADMDKGSDQNDRGRSGHEDRYDQQDQTSLLPPNIPRQGSYSKRHSSFDTPREVPFPSGYLTSPIPSLHPRHGPSTSVSMCLQEDPGQQSTSRMDTYVESPDGNVDNASESSSPLWLNLKHPSTSSLPLPTFTPYDVLPPLFTPTSPSYSNDGRTPPFVRQSSLNATMSGLEHSMVSPPGTTSLQPPEAEFKSTIKLPPAARDAQASGLPERMSTESPPLLIDEPDAADLARSHEPSQPSLLNSSSHHDTRPHNSLPPPPKMSSFSFTSAPLARPTSLPHSIGHGPLDSQSQSCSERSHFPPPQPPTVLTPPPPLSATENARTPAPYEPFLPRDQPPPDRTHIAVETLTTDYRLIIRLPGFQRDSITLAMRRRRILHVVADNWSDGGGHYERRISFGYDADLANVRAEFDGEILMVTVPRRAPSGWYLQPA